MRFRDVVYLSPGGAGHLFVKKEMGPEDRTGQRLSGEHAAVPIFSLGSELIGNNLADLADERDPAHPE